jgi:Uma2 family endonuclease
MHISESVADDRGQRQPHRWSRAEYERMTFAGVFEPDARLELVDGEILTLPPQSTRHFTAIQLAEAALGEAFGAGYHVRPQGPLAIDGRSEPEPDIAVVTGSPRDYAAAHPRTAVLILEIADSSLGFDQIAKKRLYARNRIPEYWILDLTQERLEVHREPRDDDYSHFETHGKTGTVSPLTAPDAVIGIGDLLP